MKLDTHARARARGESEGEAGLAQGSHGPSAPSGIAAPALRAAALRGGQPSAPQGTLAPREVGSSGEGIGDAGEVDWDAIIDEVEREERARLLGEF